MLGLLQRLFLLLWRSLVLRRRDPEVTLARQEAALVTAQEELGRWIDTVYY